MPNPASIRIEIDLSHARRCRPPDGVLTFGADGVALARLRERLAADLRAAYLAAQVTVRVRPAGAWPTAVRMAGPRGAVRGDVDHGLVVAHAERLREEAIAALRAEAEQWTPGGAE
jgi:hypothetical protein